MEKISIPTNNSFCPQPLFLYGTYRDDGKPNYGLFCWCTYCAGDNLKFVACIGEDKLTRDQIRKNGVFSATVVTEQLLPLADWCGTHSGRDVDKSEIISSETGRILPVPVPTDGVWTLELRVEKTLIANAELESEIYICKIENVIADKRLADDSLSFSEKLALVKPVITMAPHYILTAEQELGTWGSFST